MVGIVSLADYTPLWKHREFPFAAPFKTVNAAVFQAIDIYVGQHCLPHVRDDTAGASRYYVGFSPGELGSVFVLFRAENLTSLRVHPLVRRDGAQDWSTRAWDHFLNMLAYCGMEITQAMRYSDPDFTLYPTALTPPMPRWDDGDKDALLWKSIYARAMGDKEFAELQGIDTQTLWNARSRHGLARTPRGKQKKR